MNFDFNSIWINSIRLAQKQRKDERDTKLRADPNYTAEQTAHLRATGEYSNFTKTEREVAQQPLSYFLQLLRSVDAVRRQRVSSQKGKLVSGVVVHNKSRDKVPF